MAKCRWSWRNYEEISVTVERYVGEESARIIVGASGGGAIGAGV